MKGSTIALVAVGAVGLLLLVEHASGGGSSGFVAYALRAGVVYATATTPASGKVSFTMPAGSREWALGALLIPGQALEQLPLPTGSQAFNVSGVVAGTTLTFAWHDAMGNTQMQQVKFT